MGLKHTPGPWYLRLSDNGTPHIEHGHDCMRYEVGDLISRVCVMPAEITMTFNSMANARLIAAAPDLLKSLQAMVKLCEDNLPMDECEDYDIALASISKATGDS